MRLFRDQRGVALVTVLFVGAALTVVASTATFVTIQELRSTTNDRKSAEALAFAEAGIDRMLMELKRGDLTWGEIRRAGCSQPPVIIEGEISPGSNKSFEAMLTVYDPEAPAGQRLPNTTPWSATNETSRPCTTSAGTPRPRSPRVTRDFAITSTGKHPAATRVVRQAIKIGVLNLPIGIYADREFANGSPRMSNISMITPGNIYGREKIGFTGNDPYYLLSDFWPSLCPDPCTTPAPAAAHAAGTIYLQANIIPGAGGGVANQQEHTSTLTLNCDANRDTGIDAGTSGQSQWDQSGTGGTITRGRCGTVPPEDAWLGSPADPPPTSLFRAEDVARVSPRPSLSDQDYLLLKEAAKDRGLYCFFPATGVAQCTRAGANHTLAGSKLVFGQAPVGDSDKAPRNDWVAYFEFERPGVAGNEIKWRAEVWPCDDNPTVNQSVVVVVRGGDFSVEAGTNANGAFFIPEGTFRMRGGGQINGTIIARTFDNGGGGTFSMSECWVGNMPSPFLDITPARWAEVDR